VPYYPLYALLFLDTGLSAAQISALFAVWSVTAFVAEVPAGALADRWSRRKVLALAGVLEAAGFAVWTAAPHAAAFVVGFVLWGLAGAMFSGTTEALVYDGLAAAGARSAYARVYGRMVAAELLVQLPTAVAASALFALGGYPAVGWASVAVCLAASALALRFPEAPHTPRDDEDQEEAGSFLRTLRQGVREAVRRPGLRIAVLAVALIGGLDAVEEYFPVLAGDWGVSTTAVPLAVLVVALAGAAGAALGGRAAGLGVRTLAAALVVAAGCLAVAAVWARPAAIGAVAVFYGLYLAVYVVADARLQERIASAHRATITSVAGLGIELASLLVFAAWALAGPLAVAVLVLAVVPVVVAGLRRPLSSAPAAGTPTASSPPPPGSRD
jgi:predicted MFS family arabinose efflux permease